jgi:hypothetical protein
VQTIAVKQPMTDRANYNFFQISRWNAPRSDFTVVTSLLP